ncbi:MAG: hypothetical protein QM740_03960 [Acidovorax sp.]
MRLAPSFLLALLMLLSVAWGQAEASPSAEGSLAGVHAHQIFIEATGGSVDQHDGPVHSLPDVLTAEDRSAEMYGPPAPVVVLVVPTWAPPAFRAQAHRSPVPGQLLRPPKSSLSA